MAGTTAQKSVAEKADKTVETKVPWRDEMMVGHWVDRMVRVRVAMTALSMVETTVATMVQRMVGLTVASTGPEWAGN